VHFDFVHVYSGLSLSPQTVTKYLPGAKNHGPIKRGDLDWATKNQGQIAVIIDGRFDQTLAISPGEIMDAMRAGVRVFGSSSMGAMRAVELRHQGMIGYGAIFEYLLKEDYFKDDYLAQVFAEDITGWEASPSYIDVFFNLRHLVEKNKISKREFTGILNLLDRTHYSNRSFENMRLKLTPNMVRKTKPAFTSMGSQKARDGLGLLRLVSRYIGEVRKRNELIIKMGKSTQRKSSSWQNNVPVFNVPQALLQESPFLHSLQRGK
jgi:TfuA protein